MEPGQFFVGVFILGVVVLFACWAFQGIQSWLKARRRRKEELDYIIELFNHPETTQDKPSGWWHHDRTSLRGIIRDYASSQQHAIAIEKLSTLLQNLIKELGYEIKKVDAAPEKTVLVKKEINAF